MSQYQKLGFPKFPFFEVRVLLLRNIVAAKPMVRFGCPKHQKVYQGHKKVPCEFRTRPQTTRNLAQLSQPSPNEKWKPLSPYQLLKKSKTVFWFFSYHYHQQIKWIYEIALGKKMLLFKTVGLAVWLHSHYFNMRVELSFCNSSWPIETTHDLNVINHD